MGKDMAADAHHLDLLIVEFTAVFSRTHDDGTPMFSAAEVERVYPLLLFKAVSLAGPDALDDDQQADLAAVLQILEIREDTGEERIAMALADYARALGHSSLLAAIEEVFVRHGERLEREITERAGGEFRKLTGAEAAKAPHVDEEKPEGADSARELSLKNAGRIKL